MKQNTKKRPRVVIPIDFPIETKKRLESEAKSVGLGLAPYVRMLITRAFLTKPKVTHEKE